MTRRPLRCVPVTDDRGQVIGTARTAGPLTEADRAAVRAFDRYLRDRWAAVREFAAYLTEAYRADYPDQGTPDTDPDVDPATDQDTPGRPPGRT